MALQQVTAADWDAEVTQHPGRVVVDFHAVWCAPCRALTPFLERFAAEHPQVKFVKLDTDADEAIAEAHGVRTIPTLIVFQNGKETDRAVNPQSRSRLEDLIAE